MTYPIYYKYPGDGYNNWKVIVETSPTVFFGTTRVYPNGTLLDPIRAYGFYMVEDWGNPITLAEAVELTRPA